MALKLLPLLSAILLLTVFSAPSGAGVINVSGSVDFVGGSGTVSLTGDRGFSFSSHPDSGGIFLGPQGLFPQGETISLRLDASDTDLQGFATLEGISYPELGSLSCTSNSSCASAHIQFNGQVVAPPFGQASTAVLVVPVTFFGSFFHQDPPSNAGITETLWASATATLTLEEIPFLPGSPLWQYDSVMYDVTATPEPITLLLLGTGSMGLGWVARHRRHRQELKDRLGASQARLTPK